MQKISLTRLASLALLWAITGVTCHATGVPVAVMPVAKQFFVDTVAGKPLAFGCVYTFESGTTVPLATYTDGTGTVQNTNPIILTAAGFAGTTGSTGVFLQAGTAYTIKVVSAGGVGCALGTTQYVIDSIGGGLTLTTTSESCTGTCPIVIAGQTQLFEITLTGNTTANPVSAVGITPPATVYFELIQDSSGNHTWTWPSNSRGGCSIDLAANSITVQAFVWDGTVLQATGPCIIGNGPIVNVGSLNAVSTVTSHIFSFDPNPSPVAVTGSFRLNAANNICWRNNANSGDVCLSLSAADNLVFPNGLSLGGGTALATTNQSGTGNLCLVTNCQLITPALNGVTISGTPTTGQVLTATSPTAASWATLTPTGVGVPQSASTAGLPVSLTANTQATVLTKVVTFPSGAGTYRADLRSGIWVTTGPNACASEIIDVTNSHAYASVNSQNANGSGFIGLEGSQITSQTYAAGASVTFHLDVLCNANSTATLNWALVTGTLSPNPPSFLDITPLLSN